MAYGLAALSVALSAIPLLFVLWRVVKAPSIFLFSSEDLLIQGSSELIGPERIMTLIGILAGVR